MLKKMKIKWEVIFSKLSRLPFLCKILPLIMMLLGIIIRIFTGSTAVFYSLVAGAGIFPSPFFYYLGYFLRLMIAGYLLGSALTDKTVHEERVKTAIFSAVVCMLLLTEYKMLFISMKLFLTCLVALLTAVSAFVSYAVRESTTTQYFAVTCTFLVCESLFFIQTASLVISL